MARFIPNGLKKVKKKVECYIKNLDTEENANEGEKMAGIILSGKQ